MQLHSDDGKNSRLGYKTLILKCEVVYQRNQTRNVGYTANVTYFFFKENKYYVLLY